MTKRTKVILAAVVIGMIASFCIVAPIVSIGWFTVNPSITEVQESVESTMTLTEAESTQVSQMMTVGAVVDFVVTFAAFLCPALLIGGLIGLMGGVLWTRRHPETGTGL